MKRFSTQCMDEFVNKTEKAPCTQRSTPSRETLDFLTQFARAYHAEINIQENVCGLVLN